MKKFVFRVGGEVVTVVSTPRPEDLVPAVKDTLRAVFPNERITVKEVPATA
jgi:hypothetical protein